MNLPQLILNAEFHDMGLYGEAVGWDLDFRQIEAGPLRAKATCVAGDSCVAIEVNFDRIFHQVGCPPEEMLTFGIPSPQVGEFKWCRKQVRGGTLLNFNLESGFEGISPAGFNGHTLSFEIPLLMRLAEQLNIRLPLQDLVRQTSTWDSAVFWDMASRLKYIFGEMRRNGLDVMKENAEFLNEEIAMTLLEGIGQDSRPGSNRSTEYPHVVLKKSLEILADENQLPITVSHLCSMVGTSQSTLKRAFLAEFGIPPKIYIRSRCLSSVRDELAKSAPGARISGIANRWGFWHMGQFAKDYHKMFGELPSETSKRTH